MQRYARTKRTTTSEKQPISPHIQGHVMNAKMSWGGRVSYGCITFAALLESHRDTPMLSSLFFSCLQTHFTLFVFFPFKHIFSGSPTSNTILLFIALCNDTGLLRFRSPRFHSLFCSVTKSSRMTL